MSRQPRIPQRGDVYSIDPDPTLGKEMRDRHYWLVLTEEAVNRHGLLIAVVINTAATGMGAAGLAVPVSAGAVNGVAVLNQVRSFDLRPRGEASGVTYAGTADAVIVADITTRVASLIDPEPPPPPESKGRAKGSAKVEGSLGAAFNEALTRKKAGRSEKE